MAKPRGRRLPLGNALRRSGPGSADGGGCSVATEAATFASAETAETVEVSVCGSVEVERRGNEASATDGDEPGELGELDAAVHRFYEALEAGAEAVLEALSPRCGDEGPPPRGPRGDAAPWTCGGRTCGGPAAAGAGSSPLEDRIDDLDASLRHLDGVRTRNAEDPFVAEMAAVKQYLLLNEQRALAERCAKESEDDVRREEHLRRARRLRAAIDRRRARLRGVRRRLLEEDGRSPWSSYDDGDGSQASGGSRREEEGDDDEDDEGLMNALRVFTNYTSGKYRTMRRRGGEGRWRRVMKE